MTTARRTRTPSPIRVATWALVACAALLGSSPAHAHPHPEFPPLNGKKLETPGPQATAVVHPERERRRTPRSDADHLEAAWSDGVSSLAPRRIGATTTWLGDLGRTQVHFLDVDLALPFFALPSGVFTMGANLSVGLNGLWVPSEQRQDFRTRTMSGELWFTCQGPKRRSHHGFGFLGGGPLGYATLYRTSPVELAGGFAMFYDMSVVTRWVDVGASFRFGTAFNPQVWVDGTASVTVKPHPNVAIGTGLFIGVGSGHWNVAVRGRPVDGLELGVEAVVPMPVSNALGTSAPVWPALSLKVWDARRGASAAAPWARRLRRPVPEVSP